MRVEQPRCGPAGSPESPTCAFAFPPDFPAGPRGGATTGRQTPACNVTHCRLRPNSPTIPSGASGVRAVGEAASAIS